MCRNMNFAFCWYINSQYQLSVLFLEFIYFLYTFKADYHLSSAAFRPCSAGCHMEDGPGVPTLISWVTVSRFAPPARGVDSKWDFNSSHPFPDSTARKLDYLSESSRPQAGERDASCYPTHERDKGTVKVRVSTHLLVTGLRIQMAAFLSCELNENVNRGCSSCFDSFSFAHQDRSADGERGIRVGKH